MPFLTVAGWKPAPSGAGRGPIAKAERADESASIAGGLDDRAHHQRRDRFSEAAGDSHGHKLTRGVAGQGLANPRVGRRRRWGRSPGAARLRGRGVPPPRRPRLVRAPRARRDARRTRPCLPGRDEHLARLQPAMIVGAAKDFPVRTSHELGFGEQPPQADRGKPPLGQTVNEPARHRHTPPCFAFVSLAAACRGDQIKPTTPRSASSVWEERPWWVGSAPLTVHSAAAWIAINPRPRSVSRPSAAILRAGCLA